MAKIFSNTLSLPYQNLSLANIKGEKWEDVPWFDGLYQVSNLGRIKSLRRWRRAGKNSGYYTKDRILKPRLVKSPNNLINTNTYSFGITLKDNGKVHSISIARLVYYLFVQSFDIDNKTIFISFKDLDGRNLKAGNLILTNRSEIQKKCYRSGRTFSHWQERRLPVRQLSIKGEFIDQFKSITEAALKTGFSISAITECARANIYQHKGFRWEYVTRQVKLPSKNKNIFNEYLWMKIGRPPVSRKNPLPVLNLSLEDLKGENWKPLTGLENTYFISSLGRVKSMSRFKGNKVWLKEHILKLVPDGNKLRPAATLFAPLNNGRKFQISVARLVYYHFVKEFDLHDKKTKVCFIDGCFYNLNFNNLFLK